MAVTSITHVWSGETWDDDYEGSRNYTELYRVVSNDPSESSQVIKAAIGLPAHSTDPSAALRSRSASRVSESRLIWEVTLTYGFDPRDPEEPTESPLDEPVKYRWTSGLYTKAIIKDRDGDGILNSAGDFTDPPAEVEEVRWTVNIQKNVGSVPLAVLTYAGRVNNAEIVIDGVTIDAEAARIVALDISEYQERDDIGYRVLTISIEFREEGWDLEQIDQGFRIKDGTDLKDALVEEGAIGPFQAK